MKSIRYNVPRQADRDEFGSEESFTLHTGGVTVYFDGIKETDAGYIFTKGDTDVAFVDKVTTDVSPQASKEVASKNPNEKVPFSDE